MTMQFQGTEPQGQQTPATPTPGQEQPAGTQTPGYVTQEALDAKLNALADDIKKAMSDNYRGLQSQTGKFQAQVQKQLESWKNAAQASGIQLSADQLKAMETQAMTNALSTGGTVAPQPGQAAPNLPANAPDDVVNNAAEMLMKVYGTDILEGDPEEQYLAQAVNGSPQQYIDAVQAAIRAKQQRMAAGGQQTPQVNPVARNPGGIQGNASPNPIHNITNPDELWKLARKG